MVIVLVCFSYYEEIPRICLRVFYFSFLDYCLPRPSTSSTSLKVECYPKRDQKVSLNMVKKDQLCAIALGKRKSVLKVSLKMVAMATSHSLLRQCFMVLTPTLTYSFTKQNLTVKQAYRASLCFVLCNAPKF